MLLLSTATDRAIRAVDPRLLGGERVFVDDRFVEAVDAGYLVSALREHLARHGARLAADRASADVVLEPRVGAQGTWDAGFYLGIPSLPVSGVGVPSAQLPAFHLGIDRHEGWVRLSWWAYDASSGAFLDRGVALRGRSHDTTGYDDDIWP